MVDKIISIPISINDIWSNVFSKFTSDGRFSIKTAT